MTTPFTCVVDARVAVKLYLAEPPFHPRFSCIGVLGCRERPSRHAVEVSAVVGEIGRTVAR